MFGSLGWGLAMFFVGIALDHSTAFSSHPCGGPQRFEKNYTICFATFSVLMGAALITATQVTYWKSVANFLGKIGLITFTFRNFTKACNFRSGSNMNSLRWK